MIYLDNAATTGKKPKSVIKAVENALINLNANPGRSGHSASEKASIAVYTAREKIAEFFGADGAEQVIFTQNCTHSLNCVIKGNLKADDHVIISDFEHNAVMRPIHKIGVNYSMATVSLYDDNLTVKNFENLIKPNTKMIISSGASNVLGKVVPIAKIGELCKKHNIKFCVDAAQIAGVLPINMQEMNIDFLCIAAHKGLYAPMGLGILICRKEIENTLIEGGTGTDSISFKQPDGFPERLESGTINVPAICGVSAGLDFIKQKTLRAVYVHEMHLTQKIYSYFMNDDNFKVYVPNIQNYNYVPVLSFNFKNKKSDEIADFLNKNGICVRAGLHCATTAHKKVGTVGSGTARISCGIFNTEYEINRLLLVLNTLKKL